MATSHRNSGVSHRSAPGSTTASFIIPIDNRGEFCVNCSMTLDFVSKALLEQRKPASLAFRDPIKDCDYPSGIQIWLHVSLVTGLREPGLAPRSTRYWLEGASFGSGVLLSDHKRRTNLTNPRL